MKQIKIFLASSSTLKDFRDKLIVKIAEKNKIWNRKKLNLELVIWEDLSERMQLTRSQDAYNREIAKCDMFLLLASDDLGIYSHEEFEVAYSLFQSDGKPNVLIYLEEGVKEHEHLQEFKKHLQDIEHFPAYYKNFDEWWSKLYKEIESHLHTIWESMDRRGENGTFPKKIGEVPLFPKVFIGREGKLAKIYRSFFEERQPVLLLCGEGGVGKTTTASRYYHKYEESYTHIIWAVNKNKIEETLLSLATYLQVTLDNQQSQKEQIGELLKIIDRLQKPILLVIDNVDDYDDLMQHHHYLQQTPNIHILITSRFTTFYDFENLNIDRLTPQKAKELFLYYYKQYNSNEEEILLGVLKAIGYNTLSIELLAKNLNRTQIIGYNLKKLLADLQDRGLLQLSIARKVAHTYHDLESAKPDKIVKAMYNIAPLSEDELKLLSLFSLLPEMVLTFDNLKEISPLDEEDLQDVLLELNDKAWLEADKESFKVNTIIATIVREEKEASLYSNATEMIAKSIEVLYYDKSIGMVQEYHKALTYVGYAESFLKYLNEIEYDLILVVDGVGNFHKYYGQLSRVKEYYEKSLAIAEKLTQKDENNAGWQRDLSVSYNNLGDFYKATGALDKAEEQYQKALTIREKLTQKDENNAGWQMDLLKSYGKFGLFYRKQKQEERALNEFMKCVPIMNKILKKFPNNYEWKNIAKNVYNDISISYENLGDEVNAERFREKGVEIMPNR